MSIITDEPATISPEAMEHVAALGLQSELKEMLEHTRQSVPGLRAIDVNLAHDPEGEDEPRVVIDAYMSHRGLEYDPTEDDWGQWLVTRFSPDVFRHFVMITAYEAPDER